MGKKQVKLGMYDTMKNDKFIVKKSASSLSGEIPVMGSKNSCLKAYAATILCDGEVVINNVPLIEDIFRMQELLESIGASVKKIGERSFVVSSAGVNTRVLDDKIARSFRSSIVLTGPMLARFGEVSFPYPGGCVIGKRPIDLFLNGFMQMGAEVQSKENDRIMLKASRLHGADIFFRLVSVTGTETLMMAAVLADGETILRNAAEEPEIKVLADFLNKCGAKIKGAGTNTIIIGGVKNLSGGVFDTPPDRIEAGSFVILGALNGESLRITNCKTEHLISVIEHLKLMGVPIKIGEDWIEVSRPKKIKSIDVKTREYPGFPTDLQAPFAVLLTQADGASLLFETVFEGRLGYMNDLNRMGANIVLCDMHRAVINGPTELRAREMESPDLRAGLAFIMASSVAEGSSVIYNAYNIDRGYERIEERLRKIGMDIRRA